MLSPALDLSAVAEVVLDVDGTIAGADHQVKPRTSAAMRRLAETGVPVVLASGRSRRNVIDIARAANLSAPVISCNGSLVTDPVSGEDLRIRAMGDDDLDAIVELHRRTGQALTSWTAHHIFVTDPALRDYLVAFGDTDIEVASPAAVVHGTVLKAMIFGSREELDAIHDDVRAATPGATRSMDQFWELSDPDASKWTALSWVLDALGGIDPARVAGAGDGENDVVWMRRIGLPVAMGNARPEVTAAAVATVGHHDDDGAAELLEAVLDQRKDLQAASGAVVSD